MIIRSKTRFDYKLLTSIFLVLIIHITISRKHIQSSSFVAPKATSITPEKKINIQVKKKERKAETKGQIVNTVKSKQDKVVKTDYLSKDNNYFDRETKAQNTTKFSSGAKGRENALDKITKSALMKSLTRPKSKKVTGFGLQKFEKQTKKSEKESLEEKAKQGHRFGSDAEFGIAGNNDFIEKLPLSDFSRINTKKSKYFGYFQRIRSRLDTTWGQSLKDKALVLYSKNTRMPANENYITDLIVTMNKLGEIINLKIKGMSGVQEFDDAALEAFNNAGPFPNPPKGLVVKNEVVITWGFVVSN